MINFVILGEPKAKQRPRVTKIGHAFTPEQTVIYENFVKLCFINTKQNMLTGQLKAIITAFFPIAKNDKKNIKEDKETCKIRHTSRPDCDNIAKIILDSLNELAYKDDSQIVELIVKKYYSNIPRVEVVIEEL